MQIKIINRYKNFYVLYISENLFLKHKGFSISKYINMI
jgi:hypothetical protein